MKKIKTFQEFITESVSTPNVSRNVDLFEKALEKKGMTYADVFNRLKKYDKDKDFQDIISELGVIKKKGGEYESKEQFHAADFGKRTSQELLTDVRVGNIQEELFLLNNPSFMRNTKVVDDFTKAPDFIFKPNHAKVEFKVSNTRFIGDVIKYSYRDSGFKYFLNEDKIMIVYFILENKVAVIGRGNCNRKEDEETKDAKIKIENVKSKISGKQIDVVVINKDALIDYDMFEDGDNPEISKRVSQVVGQTANTPKFDFTKDKFYRSGKYDEEMGINIDKSHRRWKDENKNMCLRKWKELVKEVKTKKDLKNKNDRQQWVADEFDAFAKQKGILKYTGWWKTEFSIVMPVE